MKILLNILLLLFINTIYAQFSQVKIDSIINSNVGQLRKHVGDDAYIFVDFDYDFKKNIKNLHQNDLILKAGIDVKKFRKNIDYYKIQFTLSCLNDKCTLTAVHFKIKKINNNLIEFINLSVGGTYNL